MADKEPRRRKKQRRDSQKKDDVRHPEEQLFASMKQDSRESDQEIEEEPISHHHHGAPSNLAKVVFFILFSGLVVSLSLIFISLRDVERGPVDIFDMDHGDHHAEAAHDEHTEGTVHDDHHEDVKSEVTIDDFIPGLSSIFTLNNEVVKEVESPEIPSEEREKASDIESHDFEPKISVDQGILEEYIEESPAVSIEAPIIEEMASEVYPEILTSPSYPEDIYSTEDYTESEDVTPSLPSDEAEPSIEPFRTEEPEEMSPTPSSVNEPDQMPPIESSIYADEDLFTTASSENNDDDSFPLYEKADVTNEVDYEIRESLDELEDILIKDSENYIDDVNIGDEKENIIDDEEIEDEEGVDEEFDFWQF